MKIRKCLDKSKNFRKHMKELKRMITLTDIFLKQILEKSEINLKTITISSKIAQNNSDKFLTINNNWEQILMHQFTEQSQSFFTAFCSLWHSFSAFYSDLFILKKEFCADVSACTSCESDREKYWDEIILRIKNLN